MSREREDLERAAFERIKALEGLERVTLQIRGEQVTLDARSGTLRVVCTCTVQGCAHARDAMGFFARSDATPVPVPAPTRVSQQGLRPVAVADFQRTSLSPTLPTAPSYSDEGALDALAAALEELIVSIVRTGVAGGISPSARQAMEQLALVAPRPTPGALARWIARLTWALSNEQVAIVASLLDAASHLAIDLRSRAPSPPERARRAAWLGEAGNPGVPPERLSDRTLIECGREWLDGLERRSLERRYFMDLSTGEMLREERTRGATGTSVGTCPRVVYVSFADADLGGAPRRVRLLQYTLSPEPSAEQWSQLDTLAMRRKQQLAEVHAKASEQLFGAAEPVVCFAPTRPVLEGPLALSDADGALLPVAAHEATGVSEALRAAITDHTIVWVVGRLVGFGPTLGILPCSVCVRDGSTRRFVRLT